MKTLFKIITIFLFVFSANLYAQEAIIFHFDFSFNKPYGYPYRAYDINQISLEISDSNKLPVWKNSFSKGDLLKDESGYCMYSDTVKYLYRKVGKFVLKINYDLVTEIIDSCEIPFMLPDSVQNFALELFFDQALFLKSDGRFDEYTVNPIPKPGLIVKYYENSADGVCFQPRCFEGYRLTKRPKYTLSNMSHDKIYHIGDGPFSGFFGRLSILDSNNSWVPYFFGATCGTFSHEKAIEPGSTHEIVEAYPIGSPKKLDNGFYKYELSYKDVSENEKKVTTYFSVLYAK